VCSPEEYTVCIPTRNGGELWEHVADSISRQVPPPKEVLILDSASKDHTAVIARTHGFAVSSISPEDFRHGRSRNWLWRRATTPWVVFLTQDTELERSDSLQRLIAAANSRTGVISGRQLPREGAGPFEAHPRLFNYPDWSWTTDPHKPETWNIKSIFVSNSFSAWRREALAQIGGFPDTILGEDTLAAAKLLLNGWEVAYTAKARAYHSHNYDWRTESRRYFDIGVFHAEHARMLAPFGRAEGEGLRFLNNQLRYLRETRGIESWPECVWRTATKYVAYRLGRHHRILPKKLRKSLSFSPQWWT